MIERDAEISIRPPRAACTVASRSPPCAPMPGMRSGSDGATDRTRWISSGYVAPVTSPQLPFVFQASLTRRAMCRYKGSPPTSRSCISLAPGLDVLHKINTPLSDRSRKGRNASDPRYGCTVIASASRSPKIASMYPLFVFPMSARFASAITTASGACSRI